MATYNSSFNNPYPSGWKNTPEQTTPITAEALQAHTDALQAIDDYLSENPIPESGGGGTGTTNYNDLTNKPSINGTELKGNVIIDIPTKVSELENDEGYLKEIPQQSYNDLTDKPTINGVEVSGNLTAEDLGLSGGGGAGGTDNYIALTNKPSIEGVELVGDKTLADFGGKKQIRISWSDFQALPIEEREDLNIVYFIYDYPNTEYTASNIVYDDSLSNVGATNVQDAIQTVANIAKGRNQAHVFPTTADMQAWLSNADNKGLWSKGDNIYIVEINVPDWWVAEVLEEADSETGYYYKIAQLETQKVDLSNYVARGSNARLNMVALGNSDTPVIYADDKGDIGFKFMDSTGATHYRTMEEIKTELESKLPLSGGTMTGALNTQDLIPVQANAQRIGIDEKPFSSIRANTLKVMRNGSAYASAMCSVEGTADQIGLGLLSLGNTTAKGNVGNARGWLRLHNTGTYFSDIAPSESMTSNQSFNLASKGGTIPTVSLSGTTLTINL